MVSCKLFGEYLKGISSQAWPDMAWPSSWSAGVAAVTSSFFTALLRGCLSVFKTSLRDSYPFFWPVLGIPILFKGLFKGSLTFLKALFRDSYPF